MLEPLCTEGLLDSGVIDFVYGRGFREPTVTSLRAAQHGHDTSPGLALPKRAVIACFSTHLPYVFGELPADGHYVIISRDADPGFAHALPSCIHHIFAISVATPEPRVTPIPAGFQSYRDSIPDLTYERRRDNRVLVSYSLDTPGAAHSKQYEARFNAIEHFRDKPWATVNENLLNYQTRTGPVWPSWNWREYLNHLRAHDYLAVPVGYGIERAAGWEAMALGTIPICIAHPELLHFSDMPIAFVQNWDEVTPTWLDKNADLFQRKSTERLQLEYWVERIREKKMEL